MGYCQRAVRRASPSLDGAASRAARPAPKRWKRGRTVYREVRGRGASVRVAAVVVANTRRRWKNAAINRRLVLPVSSFDELGLARLAA